MYRFVKLLLLTLCLLTGMEATAQSPRWAVPYDVEINGTPGPGYIFISPRSADLFDDYPSSLMLMDSAANLVWYAPMGDDTLPSYYNLTITDFKILANGMLAYWTPESPKYYVILDSTFTPVDSITCTGIESTDEHDIAVDENGHYYLICDTTVFRDASHMKTRDSTQGSANCAILQQVVQELDPNKNVASEWYSLDHLPLEETDIIHWANPSWMDHTHMNSVLLDGQGGIITSSRNMGEITRFDQATGQVTWRLGGNGNQFTLVGDSVFFHAQHDANLTPEGHLYLYDNGTAGAAFVARYLEYDLDTVNMVATLVREHRHPKGLLSKFMGNAIHLDNDNVIVNWGGGVEPIDSTTQVTEFAPNGDIVLDLDLQNPYFTYRVHKDPLPWALPRPELTCDNGAQTLTAPAGYDYYEWSNGQTGRTIVVTDPGTYQVWVNYGIGYLSSVPVTVTDPQQVCLALNTPEENRGTLSVYPNPARNMFHVQLPANMGGTWKLQVSDLLGREVYRLEGKGLGEIDVDAEGWQPGVYVIELEDSKQRFVGRVVHY